MLVVISPAKKLDWTDVDGVSLSTPAFQENAIYLAKVAGRLSRADLQNLMSISGSLAELNQKRFRAFESDPAEETLRPAMYAFAGDTYQGLHAKSLDRDSVQYAQNHVRILSGLYGLLRPLDGVQPYRLEMGSRLKTAKANSLYAYWGAQIAEALNAQAARTNSKVLLNCASKEYFSAVDVDVLEPSVITPVFLEERGDDAKVISFYAKRARGAMARFVAEERITSADALKDFDHGGYRFDAARSTQEAPVFLRPESAQKAA
ncbi:peroxide stress protein YaaA [Rhodobacteraceae bacterium SC52]|nr:peroxide stress protein YaaA [Rhodobacteraceae bacterium SC52]